MAEQWSEIESGVRPSRSLEERLRDHPELRAKMEALLDEAATRRKATTPDKL